MREVIFRGKRLDSGKWDEGYYVYSPYSGADGKHGIAYADGPLGFVVSEADPATIGQFTGLTDKNGKRVFEGDILNIGKSKEPLIVSFVDFAWQCSTPKHKYFRHRLENCASYKIIGNIHDNPELLP
jgi:uncharacterized phage protein (TIGR01671 family)